LKWFSLSTAKSQQKLNGKNPSVNQHTNEACLDGRISKDQAGGFSFIPRLSSGFPPVALRADRKK
jgi:hypothetical protein